MNKYPMSSFTRLSTGTLVADISELSRITIGGPPTSFEITETSEKFRLHTTDRSGGDVAGWQYKGDKGNTLLIIND